MILIIYAFPGQMTQDSFDHMREARDGIYSDAHPPIINVLWKICDTLIRGQFLFLLVQSGMLLVGLYAIFRNTFEPRKAAWWTFAVFVFPTSLAVMSVIWKDFLIAWMLSVGIAALLSERRSRKLWGLLAMLGATAFRYNAFGATFPLIVLLFEWQPGMHWLKRYALATAAWLVVTLAAFGINSALTDKPMHYWNSSLALYDIVGTYAYVDEDLPDSQLLEDLAGTELVVTHDIHSLIREVYTPTTFYPILNDPKRTMWNVPINGYVPAPEAQRDAIARAWLHTITTYPLAYAKHRLSVFGEALGIGAPRGIGVPVRREFKWPQFAFDNGLSIGVSTVQKKMTRAIQWFGRHTPFFVPWIYALLSLVLLPLAFRQRDVLAILLSGLIMELTLLPLVHSNDYRYSHWLVLTTTIGAVVLATRRYRAARERRPADAVNATPLS
ncbi:hypothetical protein BH11MYX3_BH11MYX3_43250 [soil metagenome]